MYFVEVVTNIIVHKMYLVISLISEVTMLARCCHYKEKLKMSPVPSALVVKTTYAILLFIDYKLFS